MIDSAQGFASLGDEGRHEKIFFRTGESEMPVDANGPVMTRSRRCGRRLKPYAVAFDVLTSDHLIGEIMSCTTPWNDGGMNAAETRCGPALTRTVSVVIVTPFGSEAVMNRSMSSTATRSPSIEISIFSPRALPPANAPVVSWKKNTLNTYAASAGKVCITDVPPRVPKGAPSTCSVCDDVRGTVNVADAAVALRFPTASQLMSLAARRYASSSVGERSCTSAMLSKFSLLVSSGR